MIEAVRAVPARFEAATGIRRIGLAFGAGVTSALGFAPLNLFPLFLLSIAALVLLLDGAAKSEHPKRTAALIGWAFGFGQFLLGLHWVGFAFMVDPTAHAWQMPFAILLLPAGLALFTSASTWAASYYWHAGASRILTFSLWYALAEYARGHVFTGFPWNLAGYVFTGVLPILQSVAIFGIYGLSFLTVLFGASLAELCVSPDEPGRNRRFPVAMAMLFVAIFLAGGTRLLLTPQTNVPGVHLRLVQPAIPQAEKYQARYLVRNWRRLITLTTLPAKIRPTHVIWPEAAPPFLLERIAPAMDEIAVLTNGRTLMTGADHMTIDAVGKRRFYNSLLIFGPGGALLHVYEKFHLVPFGEYLPFAQWLEKLSITKLTEGEAGFSFGDGPHTYSIPGAPPVDPLICYEVLFPGNVVRGRRPGWIVNVTDDSWFGPWVGPLQHLAVARTRAIEEGLPIARDANTGVSAVIDPLGRMRASLALNHMGVVDTELPSALAETPYSKGGDLLFWLVMAWGVVGARYAVHRK